MATQDLTGEGPTLSAPLGIATINAPDLRGLAACVDDAKRAALDADSGPSEPNQYHPLRGRLEAVRGKLPPLYQDTFVDPFVRVLDRIGEAGFSRILVRDPQRESSAGLMLDIAQAILQQGEGFARDATDAFQEVVSDLYDGFLSAEDRRGVKAPDRGVIAPLVKWGNPDFGPYTWPVDATQSFQVKAAVVSMPPANRRMGVLAWAALGHETAGHDVLHADTGLQPELTDELRRRLAPLGQGLDDYWADRIDETSSDVMGILNMGPAAGIGLVGYFRGLNAAFEGSPSLRNEGSEDDPHPVDILRGFLAAETVSLLSFTGKTKWAKAILDETLKDVRQIVIAGSPIAVDLARKSARTVAETLVAYKAAKLERHALGDIQNWRDTDERKVRRIRQVLRDGEPLPNALSGGTYAAHVVAASVLESLSDGARSASVFQRMIAALKLMHDGNASWGPLFVQHPGDLTRDLFYVRRRRENGISTSEAQITASS
jgi:hypothetical protein